MSRAVVAVLAVFLIGTLLIGFDVPSAWAATAAVLFVISVLAARRLRA